jgi:amino acid adenylation domain-containing protein
MTVTAIQGFRLSPQQTRLWLTQAADVNSPYLVQCAVALEGSLDAERMLKAVGEAARRHEILRTSFQCLPGMDIPLQVICDELAGSESVYDLSGRCESEREDELRKIYEGARRQRFDFELGAPLSAALVRLSGSSHRLLLTAPAMCADTRALRNLSADIVRLYAGEGAADPSADPSDEAMQYADCAEILNELAESEETDAGREYWRGKLGAAPQELRLPFEKQPDGLTEFAPRTLTVEADAALVRGLEARAAEFQLQPSVFALACWQALLARLTGRTKATVGVAFDGRTYEQLGHAVGLFARYLPVAFEADDDLGFRALLERADAELREVGEWQDYFTSDRGAAAVAPQLCFGFDELPARLDCAGLGAAIADEYECLDRFKLKLSCVKSEGSLLTRFYYDPAFYDDESVERLAGQYHRLLACAERGPESALGELEILSEDERRRVLVEFNDNGRDFHEGKCLQHYFEEQAERTPERVALLCEDERLTYRQLNEGANRLAHYLRRQGVGPDSLVALCLERSTGMVVAMLAALKAGAAYLPLDPSHPAERLSFSVEDASAEVVLTREELRGRVGQGGRARVLCLDTQWESEVAAESAANPKVEGLCERHLAYVIYTSGSAGRPKGVQIPHRAINNHMLWMRERLGLDETDIVLQKTPYTFDASVWEFFLPLMCGATLVMARPGGHQDSRYLIEEVKRRGVTVLQLVPTMLRVMLEERGAGECVSLRRVFCGGEALTAELRERFHGLLDAELYNLYGPTETAIDATYMHCPPTGARGFVSIGRPLSNVRVYVLDRRLRPVPVGVTGELYIGGEQLARGYLNRPALTAEKFVPDPFSPLPGARLYRSGDAGRLHPDGEIEFLGRLDHQVKLRGNRIELGEIESALLRHPWVRDAAVVVREDAPGGGRLVAYVVGEAGVVELREHLKESLPEYMTPSAFVTLKAMPLLPNGKTDRRSLPAPDGAAGDARGEYAAPRTAVEELLAGAWADVLGVERVGAHDNFFDLGGHSLLVTQLVGRVREALGVELPLRDFFDARTLRDLAASVEAEMSGARGLHAPPLKRAAREGAVPLSSAQQRLWFLEQLEPGGVLYSIPTAVRLSGALDVRALEQTFDELLRRHESLRTTFDDADGLPVQVISESAELPLTLLDLSALPEQEREAEAARLADEEVRRPFDIARGPLMRVTLLRLGAEEHILLCTTHHIVSDIWSRGVLIREVSRLYAAFSRGESAALPELPIQYADYAYWEREMLRGGVLETQLAYWKKQLGGAPPVLRLPTERERPLVASLRGSKEGVALPASLLEGLRTLSRREGSTIFMTLLAAFNALLLRYTGQEDLLVGTPVSNRDRLETEGLIGFFANTLVIRTDASGNPTFSEMLARVREASLDAYAHRQVPFDTLVEELQPERDPSYAPLFQVMFVHQMAPRERLELPGLSLERVDVGNETSKYDLTLYAVEREESLSAWIEYSTDLFDAAAVRRMLGHFETVLASVIEEPGRRVLQLPLLSEEERRQLLFGWNDTRADYARDKTIAQLFEEQAARTPEAVAFVCDDRRLTYGELNRRANQVAHYLGRLGVGVETLVGVCMERSLEMVAGLLGVLKAGGAYVPLDPSWPQDWLSSVLSETGLGLVLTESRLTDALGARAAATRLVCVDSEWGAIAAERDDDPACGASPDNLAYLIYTSGSTGRPKGVMGLHRGAVNRLQWMWEKYPFADGEVCCQKTSLNYVDSLWELFGPLCQGTPSLIIPGEVLLDHEALVETLARHGVTRIVLVPSLLRSLLSAPAALGDRLPRLKYFVSSGETLPKELARAFRASLPEAALLNLYGSSEASADSLAHLVREDEALSSVPVGRPIANTRVYILDEAGQAVPVGVTGEVCVGGEGLARGYFKRAALTAEKFIPDAFGGVAGARLYRTGDLGRHLSDGRIELLGRADTQVKLRGRRVELGEVESALLSYPGVREAVVLLREQGDDKRLAAYFVSQDEHAPSEKDLRRHMKAKLPDYMVPPSFVALDSLPLLPNGKIDRRALSARGGPASQHGPLALEQLLEDARPLPPEERQRVLREWNDTYRQRDRSLLVTDLFSEQARRTPDAAAVLCAGERLSFAELDSRANRLANLLLSEGAAPDAPVALFCDRTPDTLVAILAVLKAGSPYLPLDPSYPTPRLLDMLDDARPTLLLTTSALAGLLPAEAVSGLRVLALDAERERLALFDAAEPRPAAGPENLAYVVYTSGSTGRPKGIAMSHAAFANLIEWQVAQTRLAAGARTLGFASFSFDVSNQEIFSAWCAGHALVLADEEVRHDAAALLEYLEAERVGRAYLPVVVLQQLAERSQESGRLPSQLREVSTSGAQLQVTKAMRRLFERTGAQLVNQYGPSETHVVTAYELEGAPQGWAVLPLIGRPVSNSRIYVLDARGEPVGVGAAGELYIGGECVARGYLNRPALTAEKFVPDAFSPLPGARIYRSGDLGRFLPDGRVECLGRVDHQVKIRGFRVELGEIESALAGHERVEEVVVLARTGRGGETRLVAYVVGVAGGGAAPGAGELRRHVRERLPEYMVPSAFVLLEAMPLTPNGKVDRRALPEPEAGAGEEERGGGPRTALEEVVSGIWCEVLGVEWVGVEENFFDLGGHSLLVTQVVSRVRAALGTQVALRVMFEAPTVAGMAQAIDTAMKAARGILPPPIKPAPRGGPLPLSFIQERIWQMARLEGRPSFYNFEVRLSGALDADALERSLNEAVRRNEALRTTFITVEGRAFQVVNPHQPFGLTLADLSGSAEAEGEARTKQLAAEQAHEPFDLTRGPLLRLKLVRLREDSHRLLLTIPHIICDHTSVQLLAGEVGALYEAFARRRPASIPEPAIQYADFASWEREWLQGEVYERELDYWRRQLDGCAPALQLPTTRPRPPVKTYNGAQLLTSFPEELSRAAEALARRERCTVFMTLLAAFKSLLYRYTGQQDMIVGTAVAGRTHAGVERLIGNFGTPLALRTRPSGDTTYRELLRQVREVALEAYAHQDLPFDMLVEELKPERDPSYSPLIQVGFVVHSASKAAVPPGDLRMEVVGAHSGRSIFDLTLRIHHTPGGLVGGFEYNTDLFDAEAVGRMAAHFRTVVAAVVADPDARLADLPLISEEERRQSAARSAHAAPELAEELSLPGCVKEQPAPSFYVLDADMNLAPVGVPGELCVGGLSLPRGDGQSSAGEFIADPVSSRTGARLYRTGRRARFVRDGGIELLGRLDQQVKVRGFKVDLSQVEAALNEHPSVLDCAVGARESSADGAPRVVARVVPQQGRSPAPEELRDFLRLRLPAYMIPSDFAVGGGASPPPGPQSDLYALPD